jgi:hypothetical protein
MPIDVSAAKEDYVSGAKAKTDKLIRKYTARTDKIAKATSDDAQKRYVEGVTDPVSQKKRLIKLKKLSDSNLNAMMEAKGRTAYPAGVEAAKDKWAGEFDPFAKEIDAILPKLRPPTRDAASNVANRVTPLAVGLQNKKKAMYK